MAEEPKVGACPHCRTPLAADDETCPTCGRDVGDAARHSKYARETEDRPGPRVSDTEGSEGRDEESERRTGNGSGG